MTNSNLGGIGYFVSSVSAMVFARRVLKMYYGAGKCQLESVAGSSILADRSQTMASNVSVFYRKRGGVVATRGEGVYIFDSAGKRYLDCCNNVACVGHSHPVVVAAGCNELMKIQTNTRFLHPARQRYLKKLLSTFPSELNVVYLVNSGSEANDLALRIARQHTNKEDVIVLDHAYHGHTASLIDISPYKWRQAKDGIDRKPARTHVVSCPDTFRGRFRLAKKLSSDVPGSSSSSSSSSSTKNTTFYSSSASAAEGNGPSATATYSVIKTDPSTSSKATASVGSTAETTNKISSSNNNSTSMVHICDTEEEAAALYAGEVEQVIVSESGGAGAVCVGRGGEIGDSRGGGGSSRGGGGFAAFIAESLVGCGGQIDLPKGYLKNCYAAVRAAGGVCIADEVQTGFGRTGSHFWGFQCHDVVPDIVTLGKPMGNGYPVAAVVCKRELAESFASTGIEYFNTFGGNSVACCIAEAVLDTIQNEKLQENAADVGNYLRNKLQATLSSKYNWIGDVRGRGLFLGIEIVKSSDASPMSRTPYPELTSFLIDHMLDDDDDDGGDGDQHQQESIIVSSDGPDENVIKFKPPLVFSRSNADSFVRALDRALRAALSSGKF